MIEEGKRASADGIRVGICPERMGRVELPGKRGMGVGERTRSPALVVFVRVDVRGSQNEDGFEGEGEDGEHPSSALGERGYSKSNLANNATTQTQKH